MDEPANLRSPDQVANGRISAKHDAPAVRPSSNATGEKPMKTPDDSFAHPGTTPCLRCESLARRKAYLRHGHKPGGNATAK
jgi:hypothetical protein